MYYLINNLIFDKTENISCLTGRDGTINYIINIDSDDPIVARSCT